MPSKLGQFTDVVKKAWKDIGDQHLMAMAAGLSYNFIMSLFPLLIVAAAALSYVPVPDLFDRIVNSMGQVVPPDSMGLVRAVLKDTVHTNRGGLLTFGIWAQCGQPVAASPA